jgi:isocitrate dehydrogenase
MFEAVHGSAPPLAGKNLANPSGLLLAAVMMLQHIGQPEVAARVHNAWLKTIEDGIHTFDIYREGISKQQVGTKEFAEAVIDRLGQLPEKLPPVAYKEAPKLHAVLKQRQKQKKELFGVDIFLDWDKGTAEELGKALEQFKAGNLKLRVITNRGVKVYPGGLPETFCTDHWRCRFHAEPGETIEHRQIVELYNQLVAAGYDCIKTENLYLFDGEPGFAAVHG